MGISFVGTRAMSSLGRARSLRRCDERQVLQAGRRSRRERYHRRSERRDLPREAPTQVPLVTRLPVSGVTPLLGAEDPVAGVAEARQDVAVRVELAIDGRG